MAKLIATEKKVRAVLRHAAVVCPNVTKRTKERITVQSNRARAGSFALFDFSHKWRELAPSGRLVCRCHDGVFLWCYIPLVWFVFVMLCFIETVALRSFVLRYAGAPIATTCVFVFCFFLLFLFGDVASSEFFFGAIACLPLSLTD